MKYVFEKGKENRYRRFPIACVTKGMKGQELCDPPSPPKNPTNTTNSGQERQSETRRQGTKKKKRENGLIETLHCEDLKIINGGIINKGEISEKLGVKGMDRASEDYITAVRYALQ